MRVRYLFFILLFLFSCSKSESDSIPPEYKAQELTYYLEAESCTVQAYEFVGGSSPYFHFSEDLVCDSIWEFSPNYYANDNFRRAGFRLKTHLDTMPYRAQVVSNGKVVLDTTGVFIRRSSNFDPWIYCMVDWNE